MINWKKVDNNDLVCYCKKIKKKHIIKAIKNGFTTLKKIKKETQAGTGSKCKKLNPSKKCCCRDIKTLIKLYT